ncbi:uncharacterized protein VICG_01006 [Vittaforma corneae ATCC 50505]|uniref:Uncharacterized protein n=1 Tax=Vittaforma corneae (strain ATCC 50505) TaxID=993615 RepID=L2GMY4_VITCO|nr:uncharacterized protein VICG_01006 [Vittaforma corneae ATCC 50505]ELA41989.1 hypothetical protein VICG_01006 [Vittaforma corneae ATCC 50505]
MLREQALVKILEYGKMPMREALTQVCIFLGVEFYYEQENGLFTLSTESFVLDISNSECNLIFVEDLLNSKLGYIQLYISHFLSRKHIFYYLLKYLISCTRNTHSSFGYNAGIGPEASLEKHKCICSCIFTDHYCQSFNLNTVSEGFNIFTHSKIDLPLEYYFYEPGTVLQKVELSSLYYNLAKIITPEYFDKRYYDFLVNSEKTFYENGSVRVVANSVYTNGERSPVASLAFLRGCTLKESLNFAKTLEK